MKSAEQIVIAEKDSKSTKTQYTRKELDAYYELIDNFTDRLDSLFRDIDDYKKDRIHNVSYYFILDTFFFVRSFVSTILSLQKTDPAIVREKEYERFVKDFEKDKGCHKNYDLKDYVSAARIYASLTCYLYTQLYGDKISIRLSSNPFDVCSEIQNLHRKIMRRIYLKESDKMIKKCLYNYILKEIIRLCLRDKSCDIMLIRDKMGEIIADLVTGDNIEKVINTTIPLKLLLAIRKLRSP